MTAEGTMSFGYLNTHIMKKLTDRLSWWFDYYFAYFLYHPTKRKRYHKYMFNKYGELYNQRCPNCHKEKSPYENLESLRRGRSKY